MFRIITSIFIFTIIFLPSTLRAAQIETYFNSKELNIEGESRQVIQKIADEINLVTAGGRIKIMAYRFGEVDNLANGQSLSSTFINAANRGVAIEALVDGYHPKSTLKKLGRSNGKKGSKPAVKIYECIGGGCAFTAKDTSGEKPYSSQHSKIILLEYYDTNRKKVKKVIQTSSNFSNSFSIKHNQDLLVIEDNDLFEVYNARYKLLKNVRKTGLHNSYSKTAVVGSNESAPQFVAHFFPVDGQRKNPYIANENYDAIDPVAQFLEMLISKDKSYCSVHIATLFWTEAKRNENLTEKLNTLNGQGCSVNFAINGGGHAEVSPVLLKSSKKFNSFLYEPSSKTPHIHSKYMIASVTEKNTQKNSKHVLTGSHNFSYKSLSSHDEVLLVIENSPETYNQYLADWKDIYCGVVGFSEASASLSAYNANARGDDSLRKFANGEWIELTNPNKRRCISLDSYSLEESYARKKNANSHRYFFKDVLLLPNEKIRVLSGDKNESINFGDSGGGKSLTQIVHANFSNSKGNKGVGILNNTGDIIYLRNKKKEVVSKVKIQSNAKIKPKPKADPKDKVRAKARAEAEAKARAEGKKRARAMPIWSRDENNN